MWIKKHVENKRVSLNNITTFTHEQNVFTIIGNLNFLALAKINVLIIVCYNIKEIISEKNIILPYE